jgi:predicted AAA+ superfamily ATPase
MELTVYKRHAYKILLKRILEPRRFIQVLAGPRQTGKTTIAQQAADDLNMPFHYAAADEPALKDRSWLEQQWETARIHCRSDRRMKNALLVLDEIHKVTGWSETVKRLWDEDSLSGTPLRVVLLGSAPLLVRRGLSESLAGRFEIIPVTHWSFKEMKEAFGWSVEQYIFYGGYPGSAPLISDHERWVRYINDSLIETSISRDILLMTRVDKPALLRRLFELGCSYSGQILSYQKMLGQLQDAGNTTTLAHYLELLGEAGMLAGLQKYAGQQVRQRASSPKLLVMNTALMSAISGKLSNEVMKDTDLWGRWVESAIGSSLLNGLSGKNIRVFYWRGNNREVDFILNKGKEIVAIEVKSGRKKSNLPGMDAFSGEFKVKRKLLVGPQGIPIEDFLSTPPEKWLE